MSRLRPDGGRADRPDLRTAFDPEELRRRNSRAVAMDLLYLLTTSFFAHLFLRGTWPAVIAAVPLASLLYFGWRSSVPFVVAQLLVVVATAAATYAGVVPL